MRYVFAAVIMILFTLVGFFWLLSSLGGNDTSSSVRSDLALTQFVDTPNATVRLTIHGEVNAPENHRQIQIAVSPTERRLEVLGGYPGTVISTRTFPNNQASFEAFLYSLDRAGFANERDVTITNPLGVCPEDTRYSYQLFVGSQQQIGLWSTDCSGRLGTFNGDDSLVQNLFEKQIPDYYQLVRDVRL